MPRTALSCKISKSNVCSCDPMFKYVKGIFFIYILHCCNVVVHILICYYPAVTIEHHSINVPRRKIKCTRLALSCMTATTYSKRITSALSQLPAELTYVGLFSRTIALERANRRPCLLDQGILIYRAFKRRRRLQRHSYRSFMSYIVAHVILCRSSSFWYLFIFNDYLSDFVYTCSFLLTTYSYSYSYIISTLY